MLHHADTVAAFNYGWRASWTRRNRQNRDDERFGSLARCHGLRVQLLGADGLQIVRQHLQRSRTDGRLGMLRRIQPYLGWGLVRGRRAGKEHSGCDQREEEALHLHGRGDFAQLDRGHFHHHESGLCGQNWAAWESEGAVQTVRYGRARFRSHLRNYVGRWGLHWGSSARQKVYHFVHAVQRASIKTGTNFSFLWIKNKYQFTNIYWIKFQNSIFNIFGTIDYIWNEIFFFTQKKI